MYSECLPFSAIPHSSRLFSDFLYKFDTVRRFYPEPPSSPAWVKAQTRQASSLHLRRVAAVLERQNRSFGGSDAAVQNARRIGEGARAVVTGQQVGLFGGPAFAIYKALAAIKYAQEFTLAGVECVPVFWMATEDHDLAEINHIFLPAAHGMEKISVAGEGQQGAPVANIRLGADLEDALRKAADALGETDALRQLRDAYRPEETFASAFARFMAAVFARFGLVLIDPADPELHAIASPIYSAVVEQSAELNGAVQQRGRELEAAGYEQQVKVTAAASFLFALENGVRTPVHRNGNGFQAGNGKLSSQDLLGMAQIEPQRLSPNALLRPAVQDYLLPTVLYIGGPAEVAYWAQSAPLQERLLGRVTPITNRFSATVVEPALQRLLQKYRLSLPDLFAGPEETRERLASRTLPDRLQSAFSNTHDDMEEHLAAIREQLQQLDSTLVDAASRAGAKMTYQLDRLRGRAARAELRRNEEIARHADRLSYSLYPNKGLQERIFPGAYFLARYGNALLDGLLEQVRIECHDHQVVFI